MGAWKGQRVQTDRAWCLEQLRVKVKTTDWKQAREDVRRFVKCNELPSLDLWGQEFLLAQCDKLA
jgi:hypothetical protein